MADFTEEEIVFAYQQIGLGMAVSDVFCAITGNAEYDESDGAALLGHIRSWYQKQTPRRLMELTGLPMLEVGA